MSLFRGEYGWYTTCDRKNLSLHYGNIEKGGHGERKKRRREREEGELLTTEVS